MYDLYGALIGNLSNYLYTYILIILLVAGGIYFTVPHKVCSVPLFKGIFAGRSRTE